MFSSVILPRGGVPECSRGGPNGPPLGPHVGPYGPGPYGRPEHLWAGSLWAPPWLLLGPLAFVGSPGPLGPGPCGLWGEMHRWGSICSTGMHRFHPEFDPGSTPSCIHKGRDIYICIHIHIRRSRLLSKGRGGLSFYPHTSAGIRSAATSRFSGEPETLNGTHKTD